MKIHWKTRDITENAAEGVLFSKIAVCPEVLPQVHHAEGTSLSKGADCISS